MQSPAVQRAFTRRVEALDRDLPAVLDDDVQAVHRSRVASRRLREILPVLDLRADDGEQPDLRELPARIRRLTRALGGVRELDVALGLLDDLARAHPELGDVADAARMAVNEDRRLRREQMVAQLGEVRAGLLPDELRALSGQIGREAAAERAGRLRWRLVRRVDRLDAAIEAAGALYSLDRLHRVRIAVKQLRYVLELIHEFGGASTVRLTNRLRRFQDLLGGLHDLEVVAGYVRRQAATAEVDDVLRLVARETRERHASYLAQVDGIVDVMAVCRDRIVRKLAARPSRRTRA
jgi:CHAD domain-containing protein